MSGALSPSDISWMVKGFLFLIVFFAGIVAPVGGLILFAKFSVRMTAPLMGKELLSDKPFTDEIIKISRHQAQSAVAAIVGRVELMQHDLTEVKTSVKESNEKIGNALDDIAFIRGRMEGK